MGVVSSATAMTVACPDLPPHPSQPTELVFPQETLWKDEGCISFLSEHVVQASLAWDIPIIKLMFGGRGLFGRTGSKLLPTALHYVCDTNMGSCIIESLHNYCKPDFTLLEVVHSSDTTLLTAAVIAWKCNFEIP